MYCRLSLADRIFSLIKKIKGHVLFDPRFPLHREEIESISRCLNDKLSFEKEFVISMKIVSLISLLDFATINLSCFLRCSLIELNNCLAEEYLMIQYREWIDASFNQVASD